MAREENDQKLIFSNTSNVETESCDPLAGIGDNITHQKFYKLNDVVFAEPLEIIDTGTSKVSDPRTNEFETEQIVTRVVDNVTLIEKKGKRKRYRINTEVCSLICPQSNCDKSFSSNTLLKAHIRKVHCSQRDHVCEVCAAAFTARYLLRRHSAVHSDHRVQCPVCKKMLRRRTNLSVHLRSHSDTRPHQCSTCMKRFLRKSTLDVHLKYVHKESQLSL